MADENKNTEEKKPGWFKRQGDALKGHAKNAGAAVGITPKNTNVVSGATNQVKNAATAATPGGAQTINTVNGAVTNPTGTATNAATTAGKAAVNATVPGGTQTVNAVSGAVTDPTGTATSAASSAGKSVVNSTVPGGTSTVQGVTNAVTDPAGAATKVGTNAINSAPGVQEGKGIFNGAKGLKKLFGPRSDAPTVAPDKGVALNDALGDGAVAIASDGQANPGLTRGLVDQGINTVIADADGSLSNAQRFAAHGVAVDADGLARPAGQPVLQPEAPEMPVLRNSGPEFAA